MFKQKNALISLAVVSLLAACGGGGGDDDNGGTSNPPPGQAATVDAKLAGTAVLSQDFVLFERADAPFPIGYVDFTSTTPRVDDPATPENEGATGYGAYGFARGEAAPLEAFGYRLSFTPTTAGVAETKTGRIAFEIQDQASVTQREVLRIEIDKITTSVDAAGVLTVDVADDAKVYVHATNSAGQKATVDAPALDALVKQSAVAGNPGAIDLLLDVDGAVVTALAAAVGSGSDLAVLNSVKDFAGGVDAPMEVALTISNLAMTLESNTATALVGKTITVDGSGLPGVTGGGVAKGYLQVEPASAP
jgi:hypothetical protein